MPDQLTPESDALLQERRLASGPEEFNADDVRAFLILARKLERERDEWRECANMFASAIDTHDDSLALKRLFELSRAQQPQKE